MGFTHFVVTQHSKTYWRVTFNNPPINLVTPETIFELQSIVTELEADPDVQVVVFDSAHPDFFFARYDLRRTAEIPNVLGPSGLPTWLDLTTRLSQMRIVSIASIRGRTRGVGSEFALACDMRFASRENAVFGQLEVPAGIIPGGGAIEYLPTLMGRGRALEVILGGNDFDAGLAERYGWINRAVPDAELDTFVDDLARRIAAFDPFALRESKRLLNRDTLPDPKQLRETTEVFLHATRRPEVAAIARKAASIIAAVGPEEFELHLGHYLGQLDMPIANEGTHR
jgi:enoyl-CoA hydratase/carnithine racemase